MSWEEIKRYNDKQVYKLLPESEKAKVDKLKWYEYLMVPGFIVWLMFSSQDTIINRFYRR